VENVSSKTSPGVWGAPIRLPGFFPATEPPKAQESCRQKKEASSHVSPLAEKIMNERKVLHPGLKSGIHT